jgi:21S rRNA (GM2251-2'-O)-methyltransferase
VNNTPFAIARTLQVEDVQNLGALLRSALFLGLDGVLLSAHSTAPVSPACIKASAGAAETWLASGRLLSAGRFVDTLQASRDAGWDVIGAAAPVVQEGLSNSSVAERGAAQKETSEFESKQTMPTEARATVLVLGNEGRGLSAEVCDVCSGFVGVGSRQAKWAALQVPGHGRDGEFAPLLDSLNVSAAGAVLMNETVRRVKGV